jgi:ribosomal protein S7
MEKTLEEALIGHLTRDGSRARARRVLKDALDRVSANLPEIDPRDLLTTVIHGMSPVLETRVRYVDGLAHQVPVRPTNPVGKGIRAILSRARREKGRVTAASLAEALLDLYIRQAPDPDRPKAAVRLSAREQYGAG